MTTESTRGLRDPRVDTRARHAGAQPDRDRHRPPRRRAVAPSRSRRERRLVAQLRSDPRGRAEDAVAPALLAGTRLRADPRCATGQPRRPRRAGCCRSGLRAATTPALTRRWTSSTASATGTSQPPVPAARHVYADRRARVRRRLPRQGLRRLPVAGPRRAGRHLPRAAPRVPLAAPADESRLDEPAVGQRDLRRPRARLPARMRCALGLDMSPQIEGWIPIFLFAMLFGLSMDYEVFLLSRMREEWDKATTTRRPSPTASSTPAGSSRRPR